MKTKSEGVLIEKDNQSRIERQRKYSSEAVTPGAEVSLTFRVPKHSNTRQKVGKRKRK